MCCRFLNRTAIKLLAGRQMSSFCSVSSDSLNATGWNGVTEFQSLHDWSLPARQLLDFKATFHTNKNYIGFWQISPSKDFKARIESQTDDVFNECVLLHSLLVHWGCSSCVKFITIRSCVGQIHSNSMTFPEAKNSLNLPRKEIVDSLLILQHSDVQYHSKHAC